MADVVQLGRRRGRPPKHDVGPRETKVALLREGIVVLTEKGFTGAGLEEILHRAGVPKGSFYHYFESKEAFGLALVDEYANYFARKLDKQLLDESVPPLERLKHLIADARKRMAHFDFSRGCLVGNLGQEMGRLPGSFRQRLLDVFADWEARTARCLRAAQRCGEVHEDLDCASAAAFFWIGWEGAVLRAKLERSAAPLDRFADGFFSMILR